MSDSKDILFLNSFNFLLPRSQLFYDAFIDLGFNVDLIHWGRQAKPLQPTEKGVVINLPVSKKLSNMLFILLKLYTSVNQSVKKKRYSYIHCNHIILLPIAIILSFKMKSKVIYDVPEFFHENIKQKLPKVGKFLSKITSFIEQQFLKKSHAVFTIDSSNSQLEKYYKTYSKNTTVIYNVPDPRKNLVTETFGDLSEKYSGKKVILYVGGLSRENGIPVILNAAKMIIARHPDSLFLFIGSFNSDYSQEEFLTFVLDFALDHNIEYIPWVSYSKLQNYLALAKVALSLYQPFPIYKKVGKTNSRKIFTYMQSGLPIIGPSLGMQGKCIEEEQCGITIDTTNVEAVTNAVDYLLSHPEFAKEMGERGKNAIRNKYNWQNELKKIANIITN